MENRLNDRLVQEALRARQLAYHRYSCYQVGAAIETIDGRIFSGCNIENASYGLSMCAERIAIFKAVSEGYTVFKCLVVATQDLATPCGACRQVLSEFCRGRDIEVICVNTTGDSKRYALSQLLPHAFQVDTVHTTE